VTRTTANITRMAGVAGPTLFVAAVIASGVLVPGYDSVKQVISELTARGGPGEHLPILAISIVYVPALLLGLFGIGLLQDTAMRGTGLLILVSAALRLITGTFPCDAGCDMSNPSLTQRVHMLSAIANSVVLSAAAATLAVRLFRRRQSLGMAAYSLATAALAPVFFAMLLAGGSGGPYKGLYQRISLGLMQAWLVALAVWSWPPPVTPRRQVE
jgi:hypothetical membrane protein